MLATFKISLLGIATLIAFHILALSPARACTAFAASTPTGRILAKSFDWTTGDGWLVLGERGRSRSLLFPRTPTEPERWSSRFASLTLTTVGPGFPVSGMNEAGLAIEALVDSAAPYTSLPEPGRFTGLELIQYGLDRFRNVAELTEFARNARWVQLAVPLHFLACDRSGACAILEVREGRPRVTERLPIRALANRPYAQDLTSTHPSKLERWLGWGAPAPGSSEQRFRKVARGIRAGRLASEGAALNLLTQVALGGINQWQLVWNLDHLTMTLRQNRSANELLTLELDDLVGPCSSRPLVRALGTRDRATFASWTDEDSARSRALVVLQAGDSAWAQLLADTVAKQAGSSKCP